MNDPDRRDPAATLLMDVARAIASERFARRRQIPMFEGQYVWTQAHLDRAITVVDGLLAERDLENHPLEVLVNEIRLTLVIERYAYARSLILSGDRYAWTNDDVARAATKVDELLPPIDEGPRLVRSVLAQNA